MNPVGSRHFLSLSLSIESTKFKCKFSPKIQMVMCSEIGLGRFDNYLHHCPHHVLFFADRKEKGHSFRVQCLLINHSYLCFFNKILALVCVLFNKFLNLIIQIFKFLRYELILRFVKN